MKIFISIIFFLQLCLFSGSALGDAELRPDQCAQDSDCKKDGFCKFPIGRCGKGYGLCQSRPMICTLDYRPVCSCEGRTHANECSAYAKGESVNFLGECDKAQESKKD